MSETDLLIKLSRRILARIRTHRTHKLPPPQSPEIHSTAGYLLSASWFPQENPNAPSLLLCPDFPDTSASFLEDRYPLSCADIYHAGYSLLIFDPAGRGKSWGTEDYGGLEHQDNVDCLLQWLHTQSSSSPIGVFSMGFALSMVLGGLNNTTIPVRFIMDFEGPSDEEFLNTYYPLSKGDIHAEFWSERNPVQLLNNVSTRYIRLQTEKDHLSDYDMRHCNRIFRQLALQKHPQYQLNNHPAGTYPPQPQLLVSDKKVISQTITKMLRGLIQS
jgi:hypothetical protein